MKIAICEDEEVIAQQIKEITAQYFNESKTDCDITIFQNGYSFEAVQSNYDLLFLDYKLPDINGIDLAHRIRKTNKKLVIVFVTAYSEHVFESFEVGAFRYILKPIDVDDIRKALFSFMTEHENNTLLCIPTKDKKIYIDLHDIMYIESQAKNSVVRTTEAEYQSVHSLLAFEQEISSPFFIRTHKRWMINMQHIAEIEKNVIKMKNGEKVEISRRNNKAFQTAYTNFLKYYI